MILVIGTVCLFQCRTSPTAPATREEIIISGYLVVGQGIDSVFVSRSLPITATYTRATAAVTADSVLLTVDGLRHRLLEYLACPGGYYLPRNVLTVTPGKTYHLEVHALGRTLRASAMAPEQVHITSCDPDTGIFPYPDTELSRRFNLAWTPTAHTAAYIISVIAKPPYELASFGMDNLVRERIKQFDGDTLRAFPPVRDLPVGKDGKSLEISWFAFPYYGDYTIKLYAADDALWDLATSAVVFLTQSSEFEQPVTNVEGGLGIFTAVSVDSVHAFVRKQE